LGETVAVRLFKRLREGATVPVARAALDRVLLDEVRHRDFGWLLLEWLAQRPEWAQLSALIQARLPRWLAELQRSYAGSSEHEFDESLRAWGLMPHADYRAAFAETLERDYLRAPSETLPSSTRLPRCAPLRSRREGALALGGWCAAIPTCG
jgi:hypothetical protein